MTSSQPSWCAVGDVYRRRMTSLPVDGARAQSSLSLLCPVRPDLCCGGDDGRQQVVLVVAVPLPQPSERPTSGVDAAVPRDADDLTARPTRCSDSELHANDDDGAREPRASSTSNTIFGKSMSPKSYWLRRHSDSVFADRDLVVRRADEPSSSAGLAPQRPCKERTASDSRPTAAEFDSMTSAPLDDRWPPLAPRFQSTVVGMQCSGESDDVFADAAAFQSAPRGDEGVDAELRQSEEPPANCWQPERPSARRRRGRLTVASAGDLEDIDEENQIRAGDGGDTLADPSTPAKLEPASSGGGATPMQLSDDDPTRQRSDDPARRDDGDRKSTSGKRDARPEVRRRASRVVWPPARVDSTSGCDSSTSGKVHRCVECRRTFSRSDMLERHARLHSGVRPYACRLCTQVFSRSDHLTTHLRTHTGEKPYACPRCAYTASRRDMVTRHLRVHQSAPAAAVDSGVVGPPRRRVYRSRYRERWTRTAERVDDDDGDRPTERRSAASLDDGARYARRDGQRPGGAAPWSVAPRRHVPSPPTPESAESAYRRRLEHLQTLHALSRSVVARGGSTGSSDSYSSPGCLSTGDVFEFAVGSGGGVDGSPDVFRSPSSARHSTVFLFPYTSASAALPVADSADSF